MKLKENSKLQKYKPDINPLGKNITVGGNSKRNDALILRTFGKCEKT
jgi:hypothetical protein